MSDNALMNPLAGPPPIEVPLTNPPLVRVIAQVRFPTILSVENSDFIAPFQEDIRAEYPVLRSEQSRSVSVGENGVLGTHANALWRFQDTEGMWRVTLARDFLSLDTGGYNSRDDFLLRLELVVKALVSHVRPEVIDRLGVRYIDRVTGKDLADLPRLVRPEVCGIFSSPLAPQAGHSICEAEFDLPDKSGRLKTRWGLVPSNTTVDPAAIDAVEEASWLLDIDAFLVEQRKLEVGRVLREARGFAERIYSVFRWTVTDEFLRHYGGEV